MLSKLIDIIFPHTCVGCNQEGAYLCRPCKKTLRAHPELCPGCHTPSPGSKVCYACKPEIDSIDSIAIAFVYQDLIKKLILDLKFHHRYDTGRYLGERLALLVESDPLFDPEHTCVTYVPSHPRRRYVQKGYNQSQILAETVAKQLGLPCISCFTKIKHTRSQLSYSREQRKRNVLGVFQSRSDEIPNHIRTLLIIDDVTTTGSTLKELGKQIKKAYPHITVQGVVVARHVG